MEKKEREKKMTDWEGNEVETVAGGDGVAWRDGGGGGGSITEIKSIHQNMVGK